MLLDFHTHTNYSHDAILRPKQISDFCSKMGISVIILDPVKKGYEEVKRNLKDVPVFYGCEIDTTRGEVVGCFLNEPIKNKENFFEVVDSIKDAGGIVSIPHPFDFFRGSAMKKIDDVVLKNIDCMEIFNSRSLFGIGNNKSRDFAKEHNVTGVGGSDSHTKYELGHCYTVIEGNTEDEIIKEIRKGNTKVFGRQSSPLVHIITVIKKRI